MNITPEILKRMASQMPTVQPRIECAGCPTEPLIAETFIRDGQMFCSEGCADKKLAVLRRPQPKATKIDGWDV